MKNVEKSKTKRKHTWADWKLTLLALPFVIYTIAFTYVPLFGWGLAFTNYRPGRPFDKLEFVGLKYFKLIGYYWEDIQNSLINTLALSLMSVATMVLPITFAICLNEVKSNRFKKFVQSVVTLPHFVGWVLVYSIVFSIFSSNGLLNTLLSKYGIIEEPILVLANVDFSWFFMILLGIWKGLGWSTIVYLASISGIDSALYDAAKIDGAGRFACVRYITVPSLMPTVLVLLIMNIGSLLNTGFEQYLLFANSITMPKLEVLDLYVYRVGILTQDYSFSIAVSIMKSIVSILLITIANVVAKKVRGEGIV